MKTSPDQAAVAAIATAAFLAHNPNYIDAPDIRFPERVAGGAFGLNELIRDAEAGNVKVADAIVRVFDRISAAGLQTGARIGADPLRLPEVEDLIRQSHLAAKNTKLRAA